MGSRSKFAIGLQDHVSCRKYVDVDDETTTAIVSLYVNSFLLTNTWLRIALHAGPKSFAMEDIVHEANLLEFYCPRCFESGMINCFIHSISRGRLGIVRANLEFFFDGICLHHRRGVRAGGLALENLRWSQTIRPVLHFGLFRDDTSRKCRFRSLARKENTTLFSEHFNHKSWRPRQVRCLSKRSHERT